LTNIYALIGSVGKSRCCVVLGLNRTRQVVSVEVYDFSVEVNEYLVEINVEQMMVYANSCCAVLIHCCPFSLKMGASRVASM